MRQGCPGGIWTQRATRIAGSRHHGFPRLLVQQPVRRSANEFIATTRARRFEGLRGDVLGSRAGPPSSTVLTTRMTEDPKAIDWALNLIMAARALERAGDHAKNTSDT